MLYKAFVKDKQTKERYFVEMDCRTKKQFIDDLRSNGYAVTDRYVKKSEVLDWILDNTNCEDADWSLREVPKDWDEYKEKIKEYYRKLDEKVKRRYGER